MVDIAKHSCSLAPGQEIGDGLVIRLVRPALLVAKISAVYSPLSAVLRSFKNKKKQITIE